MIMVPLDFSCISVRCRDGAEKAGSRNADSVYNPEEVELASVLLSGEGTFQAAMQNTTLLIISGNKAPNRCGRKDCKSLVAVRICSSFAKPAVTFCRTGEAAHWRGQEHSIHHRLQGAGARPESKD